MWILIDDSDPSDHVYMSQNWDYKQLPGLVNIQKANWKMAIEIVDLPIRNGDLP